MALGRRNGPAFRGVLGLTLFFSMPPCLHATAVQCPDGTPPPCRGARAPATPPPTSVAVLYFDNAAGDTANAYLADGITEEIISRLGQVGRIQVKSSYLVRRYRAAEQDPVAIGRQLGVANVLTGTLRGSGGRLRVTAELVRTATGDVSWSERYDRGAADVLALQTDLSSAVATAITGRLLPDEQRAVSAAQTRSREAWDHFLRGNYQLARRTPLSHGLAIAEYETAARLDPSLSRALARVAYAYGVAAFRWESVNLVTADSAWQLGRAAANRAVRADPASSDAWLALGLAQMQQPESLRASLRSLERSLDLDSTSAEAYHMDGWALTFLGRLEEGEAAFHRALALEPARPITLIALCFLSGVAERWAEAERWADSIIAVDRGYAQAYYYRARTRLARGNGAGARSDFGLWANLMQSPDAAGFGEAAVAALAGDTLPMRAWLGTRDLRQMNTSRVFGNPIIGLALLGDFDGALTVLERASFKNTLWYQSLLWWPLSRLRGRPRYEQLLDRWRVPAGIRP